MNKEKITKFIKELIPYILILITVVVIRTYIVTPVIVSGPSMQPTLKGGEIMILDKRSKIERFDVVVIDAGKDEIIKRVIALPGETISCEKGIIYVNDKRQDEEYSQGRTNDFDRIKLSDDEYFVLGDNRQNSKDSRHYGPFKKEKIKGEANIIIFPFSRIGKLQ